MPTSFDLPAAERGRVLDLVGRLRPALAVGGGSLAVVVAVGVPTFGAAMLCPVAAAAAGVWLAAQRVSRAERPDLLLAAAWLWAQLMAVATVALADGPRLYLLLLLVLPALVSNVLASAPVAAAAAAVTVGLMAAAALLVDPAGLSAEPFALVYPAAAVIAMALAAQAARGADVESRAVAVADALTGLPNRMALDARVAELRGQAAFQDEVVSVVIADLDRFKAINDTHGHATGDTVLADVAARLAAVVGRGGAVYRLGGEEFVVLLARASADEARELGERMRDAVGAVPVAGLTVTLSVGVADTTVDGAFDYDAVFARADAALYAAKHAGRNRVHVATAATTVAATDPHVAALAPLDAVSAVRGLSGQTVAGADEARLGWLLRGELERRHFLEFLVRLHRVDRPCYLVAFAVIVVAAPTYGWITLVPALLAAIGYDLVVQSLHRLDRPERVYAVTWLLTLCANGLSVALVHGSMPDPPVYSAVMLAILVSCTSAAFPRRGARVGIVAAVLVAGVGATTANPELAARAPVLVLLGVLVVLCAGVIGAATGQSSLDHEGAAVLDRLTGMLNRTALGARVAELSRPAAGSGQEVSLIVADLDRFKSINDQHGHAVGDRVLQETATRIRGGLRAFEAVYRVGGEEFAVLLEGTAPEEAEEIAQRIRAAIREAPMLGVQVTVSAGVATGNRDGGFDFSATYECADAALYEAKRGGRDQVRVAAAPAV